MEWYSSLFSRHVFKYLSQLLIYKCHQTSIQTARPVKKGIYLPERDTVSLSLGLGHIMCTTTSFSDQIIENSGVFLRENYCVSGGSYYKLH